MKKTKTIYGLIKRHKMNKSTIVSIERKIKHKIYNKFIKRTIRLTVHNENNHGNLNDIVEIKECRPISKTKSWKIIRIL